MGSERKPLDLETIREREMSVRDPRMYQPETIRALYLNDVTALLAEVEHLRATQQAFLGKSAADGRVAMSLPVKVQALRAEVERLASDFHTRNESPSCSATAV